LFPLAIPAYVGAYALVDLTDYSGPLQTALRAAFGWQERARLLVSRDPLAGAAVLVLSAALYPYVYVLARAAFARTVGRDL
jgi:iron(III) transport system permease protein